MSHKKAKKSVFPKKLKDLRRDLFRACEELRRTRDRDARKELELRINYLKINLGWKLFDCEEYERGLALYASLPSEAYGEVKFSGMSRALVGLGYDDEARQILEEGLKRFPQSYRLWIAMGVFHAELGNDDDALDSFETAYQYSPEDDSTVLLNKAQILAKIGFFMDAAAILKDLIERDPSDPRYLTVLPRFFISLGAYHLDMGYLEDALQDYQAAMKIWKENPTHYEGGCIYMGTYASYRNLGMLKEALDVAQEGLRRFPEEDPGLYQNLADAYYAMGWPNDAIRILKKGIETFPDDEELKEVLKEIESGMDDPEDGQKPPILGLLLLLSLIRRRWKKRPRYFIPFPGKLFGENATKTRSRFIERGYSYGTNRK